MGTQTTDICLPCQIKWQVHTSSALGKVRRWRHEGSSGFPGPAKWFISEKCRVSCKPEFAIYMYSITCCRDITNILTYFLTCMIIITIDSTQPTNCKSQRQNVILCSECLRLFSTTCHFFYLMINILDIRELLPSAFVRLVLWTNLSIVFHGCQRTVLFYLC